MDSERDNAPSFATGGLVGNPAVFPASIDTRWMGEAGPELILPLAGGGHGPVVSITIHTPDVAGVERSRADISASLARAVHRRNESLKREAP